MEHIADVLFDHSLFPAVDQVVDAPDGVQVHLRDSRAHVTEEEHVCGRLEEHGDLEFHTILLTMVLTINSITGGMEGQALF